MSVLMQCDHITKRVGNFILQDVHFELEPGYILGVIGSNGAGKTTLARVLLGSYKLYDHAGDYTIRTREAEGMAANKGDVFIDGYSMKRNTGQYKAELAGILNENPFAMKLSAYKNGILYGSYYEAFDRDAYRQLLEQYEVPLTLPLEKLSKGEQIRMQLAFALSHRATVYIFDEPAGNLDVRFREMFYEIMRDLVREGDKSIIYVTHLVEELETLADYVLWLDQGRQKGFGTLEGLLEEYRLYSGPEELLAKDRSCQVIGERRNAVHMETLVWSRDGRFSEELRARSRRPELKEIMYYEEERRRRDMHE
ncbi:MAG: ABC transporter ATP-binding protein [Lachnospiraceae bacterium]|nr:ABC transporter ATP-binding protein [Lachnospiraceae bacterium]